MGDSTTKAGTWLEVWRSAMKMSFLDTAYSLLLRRALRVYDKQRSAIAQNISQVNNPDYSRVSTDFSKELEQALSTARLRATHPKHITKPRLVEDLNSPLNREKTPVDLTREMTDLAENQIRTDFALRSLRQYWEILQMGITGKVR